MGESRVMNDQPEEPDEAHVFSQEFWDERYATHDHVWSGRPNPRLVEHATDLAPGLALDVGCGEGADVVWLAERGWRATGADLSVVALEKARKHAGEAGVADRTDWVHVDLVAGDPLPGDSGPGLGDVRARARGRLRPGLRRRSPAPSDPAAPSWSRATTRPSGTPTCATRT